MNTLKNLIIRVLTKKDLMGGKGQSRSNGKRTGALFIDNQILLDNYWVPVYIINSRNYYDQKIKQV